jgi:hypothetical protein
MPDLQEVFQMSTQKVRPDQGFVERQEFRQRRRMRNRRIGAYAMVAAIIAIAVVATLEIRNRPTAPIPSDPTKDLGIFAPVAGRILYVNAGPDLAVSPAATDLNYGPGVWAVDPNGPSDTTEGPRVADDVASTLVRLDIGEGVPPPSGCPVGVEPLGWSSDGTELLVTRWKKCEGTYYVLHADGTETRVPDQVVGVGAATAAISPDGSRVAFEDEGLAVVDIETGFSVKLPHPAGADPDGRSLTFSSDGTQIAYTANGGVWMASADGAGAHQILADEPVLRSKGGADSITWSPAGDRLAVGLDDAIYTFAPDGSDFAKVITDGSSPFWSSDGSQIAFTGPSGLAIADADGSNIRVFGFAASGPWNPGELAEGASQTTLANGLNVELVGYQRLGAQTLTIHAEEVNGKATGEFRVAHNVIRVDCADTDTDGVVILGGEATDGPDFAAGDLVALIIREGDPDSVSLYANDSGAASCAKLLKSIPDNSDFVDVRDGYDIETG